MRTPPAFSELTRVACMVAALVCVGACSDTDRPEMAAAPAPAAAYDMAGSREKLAEAAPAAEAASAADAAVRRYMALRHELLIDTSASALQQVFQDALKRCERAGCEVLSSSMQRETPYAQPSANLSARMPPKAVDEFLSGFGKDAEVVVHTRQAEDKTDQVIDAEARIRNLTQLRDRLRAMLAARTGSIKEVMEVERELTETQSQLDSIMGVRKVLANETDKVALEIQFRTRPGVSGRSAYTPVAAAWRNAGAVLMNSLGTMITFLAALLPWLVIIVPCGFGLRVLWRRLRARRQNLPR